MRGTYTRWTRRQRSRAMRADILSSNVEVISDPSQKVTRLTVRGGDQSIALNLNPDEARMIGVRLVEAAALSDEEAVRIIPE